MRSFEPTTVWVLHTGRSEPDRERGAWSTGVWILENTSSQVTDSTPPSRPSWWMMTTRSLPAPRTNRPGVKTEDGLCSREKSSANFTTTFGKCLWTLLAEFGGFCLFWSKSLVNNDDVGGCETVSVTFDLWIYFCVRVNLPPRPRAVSLEFSVCKNWRRISILLRNQSTSKISFWKAKLWLPWSALAPPRGGTSTLWKLDRGTSIRTHSELSRSYNFSSWINFFLIRPFFDVKLLINDVFGEFNSIKRTKKYGRPTQINWRKDLSHFSLFLVWLSFFFFFFFALRWCARGGVKTRPQRNVTTIMDDKWHFLQRERGKFRQSVSC